MDSKLNKNRQAIVVLHEIYGINEFIQNQCQKFEETGYDVFCPNMINKSPYSYEESKEAYEFFIKNIGFEVYKEINDYVSQLKEKYSNVFIIGFSVGATIAWRCCENSLCSGVIACYGSRIRDYTELNPVRPTLLLFAKEGSFDVHELICRLHDKNNVSIAEFDAEHGFIDSYSKHYKIQQSLCAEQLITTFIKECTSYV